MKELNKFLRLTALSGVILFCLGELLEYFLPVATHYGYHTTLTSEDFGHWNSVILMCTAIVLALSFVLTIAIMITDVVRAKKLKK